MVGNLGVSKKRKQSIFLEALIERPAHFQLAIVLFALLIGIAAFAFLFLHKGASFDRASLISGMFTMVLASLAAFVPKRPKPMAPEEIARLQAEAAADSSGNIDGILSAEQALVLRIIGDFEHRVLDLEQLSSETDISDETSSCLENAREIVEALKHRARELQRIRKIKSVKRAIRAHRRIGDFLELGHAGRRRVLRIRSAKSGRLPRTEWEQVLGYLVLRCEKDLAKSAAA